MKKELADYLNKETEKLKVRQRFERPVTLPAGHKWVEVESNYASETWFTCSCGATFTHDMIDNSQNFEDGDGTCDEENENS
jgi:hypothetical protein